jgi:TonB family protein
MANTPVGINVGASWVHQGPSIKWDVLCFALAITLHVPLFFMKFDSHKRSVEKSNTRLVSIDLIEPQAPKPVVVEAPPPVVKQESSLMAKLKALVKKEPPPPPPPEKKIIPEKLADAPKPLELQAKLNLPEKINPTLQTKSGFKTTADPKLVEDKKISMQAGVPGIAPLSAQKLGTVVDRESLKNNKGSFQVGKGEKISSIGGDSGPSLSGAAAPVIALKTGSAGSTEKFSAPVPQKSDKGRIGAVASAGLGSGPKLGLRDSIIARDAAPAQIGNVGSGGAQGGVPGGIPGGVGTKRDAGRFQGGSGESIGGSGTGLGGTKVSAPKVAEIPVKKKENKSMFVITGPLKDRKIEKQVVPEYPAWAQSQGIEASVVLEFTVDPSGIVKNSISVRRTSGYPKLDDTAIKALLKWKFIALPEDENREEVGLITFNYSLS